MRQLFEYLDVTAYIRKVIEQRHDGVAGLFFRKWMLEWVIITTYIEKVIRSRRGWGNSRNDLFREVIEDLVNIFDHRDADTANMCIIKINTKVIMYLAAGNSNWLEGVSIVEIFKVLDESIIDSWVNV